MGLGELSRTNMTFDASVKAVSEGKYDVSQAVFCDL